MPPKPKKPAPKAPPKEKPPKVEATKEEKKAALIEAIGRLDSRGLITYAAKQAGVDLQTVKKWCDEDPDFEKELRAAQWGPQQAMLDLSQMQLFKAIAAGSETAIYYYLNNHGASAGYLHPTERIAIARATAESKNAAGAMETVIKIERDGVTTTLHRPVVGQPRITEEGTDDF